MSYDLPPPRQEIFVSAGTAFKIGFFGAFGAFIAGLILSVILFLISLLVGGVIAAAVSNSL